MSGGRPWTTGEARQLYEMRAKRIRTSEIAAALGRTEQAIFSFVRYVPATRESGGYTGKTPPRPPREIEASKGRTDLWTRDEMSLMRSMAEEGASAIDVAEMLGRTPDSVRTKASKLGIKFRRQGGNPLYQTELSTKRFRRDAIRGSAMLRDAILAAHRIAA